MGIAIKTSVNGTVLTELPIIEAENGEVLHVMKCNDPNFFGFGEAYFSVIRGNALKGWRRHHKMNVNIVVPVGSVRFVIYDDRPSSSTFGLFDDITISRKKYYKLTIPPLVWFAFQGQTTNENIVLNVADIEHGAEVVDQKSLDEIEFDWT